MPAFSALVDLLICFHQAAHPVQLDETRFERHELGTEVIRPYASKSLLDSGRANLPGTALQPVPLLIDRMRERRLRASASRRGSWKFGPD